MKIAVIAPTEIPARRANTLQVMKMTQALCALGHAVRLAVPTSSSKNRSVQQQNIPSAEQVPWEELARHYGLQHPFPIDWLQASPRMRRYDFSLRAVRWARRWRADLLYTRLPQAAAIASTLSMPTILEIHDLPQGIIGPWLLRRFVRAPGAYRLVLITQALAEDLAARFDTPLSSPFTLVAPDGVDLDRYSNLPSPPEARRTLSQPPHSLPISVERFTAGYTGHLYPGRGSQLLLALATRLPEITFLIAGGETQDVARLQAQVQAKELGNVLLTDFVPNAELPLYQAACDVLLMPYQERVAASSGGDIARYLSPMKMFEYLACKRAILSSDLPVLQEVLHPGNAVLLPMHDLSAWERALQQLQNEPDYRARLAAQARLDAGHYTWAARAAKILGEPDTQPKSAESH